MIILKLSESKMHLSNDIQLTNGVVGGLIIGASSTAMLYYTGKVTGISGITERIIVSDDANSNSWTVSYILGLVSSGMILNQFYPLAFGTSAQLLALNSVGYASAGLLTGFGSRLGSGCTSGHGICGLPRRSVRSLAAVLTFMSTGAISAYMVNNSSLQQLLAAEGSIDSASADSIIFFATPTIATAVFSATLYNRYFVLNQMFFGTREGATDSKSKTESSRNSMAIHGVSFLSALLFGLGLGISGMCNTDRVKDFLNFTGPRGWDPTLMGVMGGGVLFNLISFHIMKSNNHTVPFDTTKKMDTILKLDAHPDNMVVDWKLIIGSGLFGLGWGLGNDYALEYLHYCLISVVDCFLAICQLNIVYFLYSINNNDTVYCVLTDVIHPLPSPMRYHRWHVSRTSNSELRCHCQGLRRLPPLPGRRYRCKGSHIWPVISLKDCPNSHH